MERNTLFPVFLKLEKLNLLLIGGGNVALEKLGAILGNSPEAKIKLVAKEITEEVREVTAKNHIHTEEREFIPGDLEDIDLAVIAVNDPEASAAIYKICREKKVLTNVADKPALCDFYLSSIVQKGNLKIAISTNGKSPTIAKRIKEVLNESFPAEMEELLGNMEKIRNSLSGNFSQKVKQLNDITRVLAEGEGKTPAPKVNPIRVALYLTAAILFMLIGYFLFPLIRQ